MMAEMTVADVLLPIRLLSSAIKRVFGSRTYSALRASARWRIRSIVDTCIFIGFCVLVVGIGGVEPSMPIRLRMGTPRVRPYTQIYRRTARVYADRDLLKFDFAHYTCRSGTLHADIVAERAV